MKRGRNWITVILAVTMICSASQLTAAETLGQILRDAKWEGILGTWVDPETKDVTRFAWKFKDKVIEVRAQDGSKETVSLVGVNARTGEIFNMGASSDGTSFLGDWKFQGEDAELGILYTSGDGQDGALSVKYHRVDADTMTVQVFLAGVTNPVVSSTVKRQKTKK